MQALTNLAIRWGFKRAEIFGTEPPYPNPHGYPTNARGVPIVPRDAVTTGMFGKIEFSGGQIVSGSGERSFIVRTEFGAPTIREGDLFAFANTNPDRPALVYEVVEAESGRGAYTVDVQDVGLLEDDSLVTDVV